MEEYENVESYNIKLTYEELCRKLISQDLKERVDAELELLGRYLYYDGD